MRISIVGLTGSGKSTLAAAVSRKLNIPHIHLDRFWFESGGRQGSLDTPNIELVRSRIREKVLQAIATESWVSDGSYTRVQSEIADRAGLVIFLDMPTWRRLVNTIVRICKPTKRHPELTVWDDVKFLKETIKRSAKRPKLIEFLAAYEDKTIVLHSRKEIRQFLQNLKQ